VASDEDYAGVRYRAIGGRPGPQRAGFLRYVFPRAVADLSRPDRIGGEQALARRGPAAGYAIIGAFVVCYLVALPAAWTDNRRRSWAL